MSDAYEPVVFELADGTEVSNDPAFRYKEFEKQEKARLAELLRIKEEEEAARQKAIDEANSPDDEYESLDGNALKELAAERGVDITGLKKVSQVRQALRDAELVKGNAGAQKQQ